MYIFAETNRAAVNTRSSDPVNHTTLNTMAKKLAMKVQSLQFIDQELFEYCSQCEVNPKPSALDTPSNLKPYNDYLEELSNLFAEVQLDTKPLQQALQKAWLRHPQQESTNLHHERSQSTCMSPNLSYRYRYQKLI